MKPQNRRGTDAEKKPHRSSGDYRSRTFTPLGLVGALAEIATEAGTFHKVWIKHELDPGFRETLMLGVARFNDSKYCSWAHHEWAMIEGVPEKDVVRLERMDSAHFDRKTWLAITFSRELVAANFGRVPSDLLEEMRASYTAGEIEEITLVAKVMNTLNRTSNSFEAFLSRVGGKPSNKSYAIDEAIMSVVVLCAIPPLLTFFSRSSDLSVEALVRRLLDYTRQVDEDRLEAAQRGDQRARPRKRSATGRKKTTRAHVQLAS